MSFAPKEFSWESAGKRKELLTLPLELHRAGDTELGLEG